MSPELQGQIRELILAMDQPAFEDLMFRCGMTEGLDVDEVGAFATQALLDAPPEVKHWWGAPCDCRAHLN